MGCSAIKLPPVTQESIYEFSMQDIEGNTVELSKYQGKVMIIANVASGCGLTKRTYCELNELYSKYKGKGLAILAFPCNQFFCGEPGGREDIKCCLRNSLRIDFDIFEKTEVNGKNACQMFRFLRDKSSLKGKNIGWNFGKFVIDRHGNIHSYHGPRKMPLSFENEIIKLLDEQN
ncbi:unnamed protein product [Blepharisma stoltei]|uniref:Glutathione peroxidase n=1 Tax=Blepharisma stoltei TaxID=1481888 RepID=A0AAU9J6J4_9CILI|nr:unnamed protein product [Blepharisma stoltei]